MGQLGTPIVSGDYSQAYCYVQRLGKALNEQHRSVGSKNRGLFFVPLILVVVSYHQFLIKAVLNLP